MVHHNPHFFKSSDLKEDYWLPFLVLVSFRTVPTVPIPIFPPFLKLCSPIYGPLVSTFS